MVSSVYPSDPLSRVTDLIELEVVDEGGPADVLDGDEGSFNKGAYGAALTLSGRFQTGVYHTSPFKARNFFLGGRVCSQLRRSHFQARTRSPRSKALKTGRDVDRRDAFAWCASLIVVDAVPSSLAPTAVALSQ